ncbi:MAG: hypothetical protein M1816_002079 [Peltula sp. TS41687]|nr:MAG: hypothetical protein M1816_002079 [Peltula sp. TS41687]
MRHVFGNRPGTGNVKFPTHVDLNIAHNYFQELEGQPAEFEAVRKRKEDRMINTIEARIIKDSNKESKEDSQEGSEENEASWEVDNEENRP